VISPSCAARGWRRLDWVLLAGVVLLAGLAQRAALSCGLVGFDTFMQIVASKIESWSDFTDTFRESLTDGRIDGVFYRPLQNLLVALDYSRNGVQPLGYQITSLAVFAIAGTAIFACARRTLGPAGRWPAALGAAFFVLHPALVDVVPVVCRRSETLCILLMAASVAALPDAASRRPWTRRWAAALLALLAAAAKETGAMSLGLIALHQFMSAEPDAFFRRARRALLASAPAMLLIGGYLMLRGIALGGAGGYPLDPAKSYLDRLGEIGFATLGAMLAPDVRRLGLSPTAGLVVGTALLAVCAVTALTRPRRTMNTATPAGIGPAGLAVLAIAWMTPPLLLLGFSRWSGSWYAAVPLAAAALLLAAGAAALRSAGRTVGLVGGLAICGLMTLCLPASPLWTPRPEWGLATRALERTLSETDARLPTARPGTLVRVPLVPRIVAWPAPAGVTTNWIVSISEDGLKAYLDLMYPHIKTRVITVSKSPEIAAPDEVLVVAMLRASVDSAPAKPAATPQSGKP
jgi:hypothetical protein